MRRLLALPLTAPLLAALLLLGGPAHAATGGSLRAQVEAALSGSSARSVAVAVDVAGLGAVDRRGSTAPLPPASTEKLFTAETALRVLGPDFRQRTELRTAGEQFGPLLRGDLYLVASGDPFLTSAQLDGLARSFAASGIKTISGHLVVDDTRYDRVRRGAGWKSTWMPQESGPLSAMAVDGNQWRHDAAFLADPATPVLSKVRAYLDRKGIRFTTADARRGAVPARATAIAGVSSAPLSATLTRVLKDSDNFAAELLLKEVGRVARGAGTAAAGAQVVHDQTGSSGTVADGSGLSPYDRQTAAHELELLQSSFDDLKTKLPVGCRDGTLQHRFCETAAAGRVYAKTGTLDTSRALAGWTYTRDGYLVTFSFLLSGFTSGTAATKAIDRAVVVLAGATIS
jgi:D-alanyl-D-alanine carboxypeptidase/D-alanyl-D-alanine-endopeptidase (penicillin-binding protein 4)